MRLRASISPPSGIEAGCDSWLLLDCPRKNVLTAPAVRRIPWSRQEHFRTGRHVARRLVGTDSSGGAIFSLCPYGTKGLKACVSALRGYAATIGIICCGKWCGVSRRARAASRSKNTRLR
jgi:hypothetical protein